MKNTLKTISLIICIVLVNAPLTSIKAQVSVGVNINIPWWAPSYDEVNQVHYYYLPDIEGYYDVWNHEFIYMEDGQWIFSSELPPAYSGYDLNNAYVVLLDANVYEPWRHFHYYVAHYPRYYYRSVYSDRYLDREHPLRGFDENRRGLVFHDAGRASEHYREGREIRHDQREIRQPQRVEYYGRTVGSPVKVEKQMRQPKGEGHDNGKHRGEGHKK